MENVDKITVEEIKEYKTKMCDLLNFIKKFNFCKSFALELDELAFDIQDVMENHVL